MNRGVLKYLPLLLYTLLLFAVWIGSWASGMIALLGGNDVDFVLTSGDGVRHFVYESVSSVAAMPWGAMLFLLMASGLFVSCGLPGALLCLFRQRTTLKMRLGLWTALLTLAVLAFGVVATTLYPLNLTKSVLDTFADSPMAAGFLFVLFSIVLMLSLAFGVVYGTFKSVEDVVDALCSRIRYQAPSLVTLVPAALLLLSVEYMDLGWESSVMAIIRYALVAFPFVYGIVAKH